MQSQVQALGKTTYSRAAILLHWATALCVLIAIPLAIAMNNLPEGPLQDTLFNYHKSFGQLIWFIAVLRIANRWIDGAPVPVPTLTAFERQASHVVHILLYVLIFVLPILGYLGTGAYPAPLTFFFFDMPNIVPAFMKNEATSGNLLFAHKVAGITLTVLVSLHIAAALFHALIKKDGVLARMTGNAG